MGKHDEALILWFDDIGIDDVPLVGGKNASLGEMYQHLTSKGVAVPHGFAITAYAYRYLLKAAGVEGPFSSGDATPYYSVSSEIYRQVG